MVVLCFWQSEEDSVAEMPDMVIATYLELLIFYYPLMLLWSCHLTFLEPHFQCCMLGCKCTENTLQLISTSYTV